MKTLDQYRLSAWFLAMLVLLSSLSFAVDLHYCQGQLKSFSLIGKAKKCHQASTKKVFCAHHNKLMVMETSGCEGSSEDDCCKSKIELIDSDQDLQFQQISNLNIERLYQNVIAFAQSFQFSSDMNFEEDFAENNYEAPMITWDFSARYAVLIL